MAKPLQPTSINTPRRSIMRAVPDAVPVETDLTRLQNENERLRRLVEELRTKVDEFRHQAEMDTLTPIANRRRFLKDIDRSIYALRRYQTPAVVVYIDVNQLKKVNDALGHGSGDRLLLHVADVLDRELRTTDSLARLGGDEFGIVLNHIDLDVAGDVMRRLAAIITEAPVALVEGSLHATIAWGLTPLQPDDEPEAVIARADAAMYAGRQSAKGQARTA